jgi:zeta-carotene desaturase
LNEDLDRMSIRYAAQVFRESFMNSAEAGRLGVPSIPLSQLYASAIDYVRARGGEVLLRQAVTAFKPTPEGVCVSTNAGEQAFGYAVLAVPFQTAASLLPTEALSVQLKEKLEHFEPSSITGIHLWFDREITPLPHAVLLDRTIQWMFQKSKFQHEREGPGSYVELVVSASKLLVQKSREEILDLATRELAEFFPTVKEAKVLKAAVIKEVYATYSVLPGLDQFRPAAQTAWPRIFLAGDWTATGWPATMEGAVRSGYLAAASLTESTGQRQNFLAADLPPVGLMKLIG